MHEMTDVKTMNQKSGRERQARENKKAQKRETETERGDGGKSVGSKGKEDEEQPQKKGEVKEELLNESQEHHQLINRQQKMKETLYVLILQKAVTRCEYHHCDTWVILSLHIHWQLIYTFIYTLIIFKYKLHTRKMTSTENVRTGTMIKKGETMLTHEVQRSSAKCCLTTLDSQTKIEKTGLTGKSQLCCSRI